MALLIGTFLFITLDEFKIEDLAGSLSFFIVELVELETKVVEVSVKSLSASSFIGDETGLETVVESTALCELIPTASEIL